MLPPLNELSDVLIFMALAICFYRIGRAITVGRRRLVEWSWGITAAVFVLDAYLFISNRPDVDMATCLAAMFHAVLVAGAAVGICLILLGSAGLLFFRRRK